MPEGSVTRSEVQDTVDAAEARGIDLIERVTDHFDHRLKDSERVLTWRMMAVGGMTGVLTSALDIIARGSDSTAHDAAATVIRLFS